MSESFDIPQTHPPFHIEIRDGDYFLHDTRGTLIAEVHGVARKQRAEHLVRIQNQLSLYRGLLERALERIDALGDLDSYDMGEWGGGFAAGVRQSEDHLSALAKEIVEALSPTSRPSKPESR